MNKKAMAALVGALAFGTATVTYAGEAPAAEKKDAKAAKKGDKKGEGDKKGGEKSCGGEKGCKGEKK